jgi:hypothetical protein
VTVTVRTVPIVNNPEVTDTLSNCVLCLAPIAKILGAWHALAWTGKPVSGGVLCPTTTGEVTGHQPEPALTWAERWDATVHFH